MPGPRIPKAFSDLDLFYRTFKRKVDTLFGKVHQSVFRSDAIRSAFVFLFYRTFNPVRALHFSESAQAAGE